jgi:hypothetical protein
MESSLLLRCLYHRQFDEAGVAGRGVDALRGLLIVRRFGPENIRYEGLRIPVVLLHDVRSRTRLWGSPAWLGFRWAGQGISQAGLRFESRLAGSITRRREAPALERVGAYFFPYANVLRNGLRKPRREGSRLSIFASDIHGATVLDAAFSSRKAAPRGTLTVQRRSENALVSAQQPRA